MKRGGVIICTAVLTALTSGFGMAAPDEMPEPPKMSETPKLPDPPKIRDTSPPRTGPARPDEAYGSVTGPRFYRQCLQMVNRNADRAYTEARLWRDQGGGAAAEHCAAMALARLGHFEKAAQQLTRIAGSKAHVDPELRAEIFGQAGLLWLMKGKPEPAHEAFSQALLTAPPGDPARAQYLFDRAQAAANLGRWRDTVNDLTQTLALGSARADAFVLRARAHRALGDLTSAWNDVNAALNLEPENAQALLERGQVRRDRGDAKGARADWLRAKSLAEESEIKEAARHKLAELDAETLRPECEPGTLQADTAQDGHMEIIDCPR